MDKVQLLSNIFQVAGILIGLCGAFLLLYQIKLSVKVQKLANLHNITDSHREIWGLMFSSNDLERVTATNPDLENKAITAKERMFVTFVILQLQICLRFRDNKMLMGIGNLEEDAQDFFSFPLVNKVWEDIKKYQDPAVIKFIDDAIEKSKTNQSVK